MCFACGKLFSCCCGLFWMLLLGCLVLQLVGDVGCGSTWFGLLLLLRLFILLLNVLLGGLSCVVGVRSLVWVWLCLFWFKLWFVFVFGYFVVVFAVYLLIACFALGIYLCDCCSLAFGLIWLLG